MSACETCLGVGKVRGTFDTNEYTGEPLPADDCPRCEGSGIEPGTTNTGINDDKAQESPLASSPKVAPTAGGVTAPGVSHYRVEPTDRYGAGCKECGQGRMWSIVSGEGDDEEELDTSWGDKEFVEDFCEHLNKAYNAGRETADAELLQTLKDARARLRAIVGPSYDIDPSAEARLMDAVLARVRP